MKKTLIPLILILTLLMCFVSCDFDDGKKNNNNESKTEQSTEIPEANKTTYEILNELVQVNYKKVELDITTITGDIELESSYVLTDSIVAYSVEQLNMLPSDGNIENISPNYKVTLMGTAIIENGKVVKLDGESVTLPSYDDLKGSFNFKEGNFKNIKTENGKFTADVSSPSEFLGIEKFLNDMKIVVDYNFSALQKITITYKTTNSTVTIVYEFEK